MTRTASLVGFVALLLVIPAGSGCAAGPASSESEEGSAGSPETGDAELRAPRACTVSSTVSAEIAADLDATYDYVVRRDTPARDLRSFGPMPGVREDRLLTAGGWDRPGARRKVFLENGSTLVEELELLDRPTRFAYRVSDFSAPISFFASEGRGAWTFEAADGKTSVSWTYTFTPRSCVTRGALEAFTKVFFHPYMERGLASIRRHVEASAAPTDSSSTSR